MDYPDNCIRGVPNEDFLAKDGFVGSHLFNFNPEQARDDAWIEQSINWADDDSVIDFTLSQKKDDGTLQFNAGVVIIPREEIDRLNKRPAVKGSLSYERPPLLKNPYHGNLLLRTNTSKSTKRLVAAGLALAVSRFIAREGS